MNILLIGNTGYLTKQMLRIAFPGEHVVVVGNPDLKTDKKNHLTSFPHWLEEQEMEQIFESYCFERVIYFSNFLTLHGTREGELERLRKVMKSCYRIQTQQIVYLTSLEGSYQENTGKTVITEAAEHLCRHYMESTQMPVKMVRIPFLYSPVYQEDFIYKVFDQMEQHQVTFEEAPGDRAYFLSIEDLGELLYRIFDSWDGKSGIMNVPDCFSLDFGQLGESLKKLDGNIQIEYLDRMISHQSPENDKVLRYAFGWFPRISILDDLPDIYRQYRENKMPARDRKGKVTGWIKRHGVFIKIVELAAGWLFAEWLTRIAGNTVQFRMIDLRLLFIVLMGSIYGMDMGLAAAGLEMISLIFAYGNQGTNWMTLFYEPTNWIAFIAYFTVGAICGYVRLKTRDGIAFVKRENELIQEKYFFMRGLYQDALQDKKEYKKQIVGSRDSFGKIFEVTRQLDVARPQAVFAKSIYVMEDILENQSISVYSIGTNKNYGRLEAASKALSRTLPNSIKIEDYKLALDTLLNGEVWTNTNLVENYPMYMAGISRGSEMVLLIMIHRTTYAQMGLYYMNLVRILCGLIESSMLRALDYEESVRSEQYIDGSMIMKEKYFLENLELRHSMLEQRIADYALLRLERGEMTLEEADTRLRNKIRENDILGISGDGILYLILTQVNESSVSIVTERLEKSGFTCKVTPQVGED